MPPWSAMLTQVQCMGRSGSKGFGAVYRHASSCLMQSCNGSSHRRSSTFKSLSSVLPTSMDKILCHCFSSRLGLSPANRPWKFQITYLPRPNLNSLITTAIRTISRIFQTAPAVIPGTVNSQPGSSGTRKAARMLAMPLTMKRIRIARCLP